MCKTERRNNHRENASGKGGKKRVIGGSFDKKMRGQMAGNDKITRGKPLVGGGKKKIKVKKEISVAQKGSCKSRLNRIDK